MQPSGGKKSSLLGVAAAAGLALAGVATHASPVAAAGQVSVQASGQAAMLAGVQIGLLDAQGVDVAPVHCQLTTVPTLLRLTCLDLPDGSYRPTIVAPTTGVGFTSWCTPSNVEIDPEPDGSVLIRDGVAMHLCTMNVFPTDGSGEITATMSAQLAVPFGLASTLTYQYLDEAGVDHFDDYCSMVSAQGAVSIDCAGHVAGSYRLAVAGLPSGAYSRYQCVAEGGPALPSPTDIRITSATGFVRCDWAIGPPTVRITVHDADVAGTADGVELTVRSLGGSQVACIHPTSSMWECSDLRPGRYDVTSNLVALGLQPVPLRCSAAPTDQGVAASPIVIDDVDAVQFTRCVLGYRVPQQSTATTAVASQSAGQNAAAAVLPSVGGHSGVAWLAAALLVAGCLLSAATRRPVR